MEDILSKINSPEDIKKLSIDELRILAKDIRGRMIDVVSKQGGHLSSSLGVVELTIALHYIFDAPSDKIIWDVGHQIYAHKLITGRRDRFDSLRTFKGISGFPNPAESPFDAFICGHSSTSVSIALGMVTARDLKGSDEKIVAVIGDGALSGGIAFEALNNAGLSGKDLLVVLNANDMSISPSVGAFARYLNSIITNPLYNKLKYDIEEILERIPHIGHFMVETAHKMGEGVKGLLVPGVIFEEMGFRYFGPINGHDLPLLVRVLKSLKHVRGPKILHVSTKKGKGYPPAERSPDIFHSASPFIKETGKIIEKKSDVKSFTQAFSEIITELGNKDKRIIAITAAMMHGTGLDNFSKEFPDRFFDVGIAEQHAITFAGGTASYGLKPVVAIYSTFLQRGFDQILHDISIGKYTVIFAIDRAGLVGADGPTHHGIFDISFMRPIPNLIIMQPVSEKEMHTMFKLALNYDGPAAIRYPKGEILYKEDKQYKKLGIGKGRIIKEGNDVLLIALGNMLPNALEAALMLEKEGISACVVDPRFIKPVDEDLIVKKLNTIKKCCIIEDHVIEGGFGDAILEMVNKNDLKDVDIILLGYPDQFIEHGQTSILMDKYGLSPEKIYKKIKKKFC